MVGLASAMFVALFGWGDQYFGWGDPDGKVQLALATAFVPEVWLFGLLAATGANLYARYRHYRRDMQSIVKGLKKYKKAVATSLGVRLPDPYAKFLARFGWAWWPGGGLYGVQNAEALSAAGHDYDTTRVTPAPIDTASAKKGEGEGWPWIWLVIVMVPLYWLVITSFKTQSNYFITNPLLPPVGEIKAVLMPTTLPLRSNIGPPLLPILMDASVWM